MPARLEALWAGVRPVTVSAPAHRAGVAWPRLLAVAELAAIGAGYPTLLPWPRDSTRSQTRSHASAGNTCPASHSNPHSNGVRNGTCLSGKNVNRSRRVAGQAGGPDMSEIYPRPVAEGAGGR